MNNTLFFKTSHSYELNNAYSVNTLLFAFLFFISTSVSSDPLYYDESIDGDLGYYSYGSTEVLKLRSGVNVIRGEIQGYNSPPEGASFDERIAAGIDDFIFTVQDNRQLIGMSLTLELFEELPEGENSLLDGYAFNKLRTVLVYSPESGYVPRYDVDIGYGKFLNDANEPGPINLFNSLGIEAPLEAGVYQLNAIFMEENIRFSYEYQITVSAVPLPASFFLLLTGVSWMLLFFRKVDFSLK